MTGRYGNGARKGAAPSFSPDEDKPKTWQPKHATAIRRVSKGPNSDTLSVRNLLPPDYGIVRITVIPNDADPNVVDWLIKRIDDNGKAANS